MERHYGDFKMLPFKYADKTPASDYICHGCQKRNVKLWRESGFFYQDEMRCAACVALYAQKKGHPIPLFDAGGESTRDGYQPSNQFFLYMPCVPAEDASLVSVSPLSILKVPVDLG